MASQEEDNKLECISNVNKEQERYFLNVYKKHECVLNNKNESFENKVQSLIDVWKSIGELNLSQFDIRHVIQIMDWAKLHALNIVLTAEWNAFKATCQARLLEEIEKAQTELLKLNSGFATRCKKLADVVRNPWEDSVLMTLMKTKDAEIGPEEVEFFCVETAYVISVRLKKLCESQCEDLALNLVTAFMNCNKLSKTQNFSLNATETQMWFIFDIYIALLYKFQDKQKIVVLLKELTFEEGLQLVKRFAKKRVKISKIWKNCHRVAVLATQMYISQAVVKYTEELKTILGNYIEIYLSLCNSESLLQDFTTSIRRISNLADAAGLYIFCDVIQKKAGTTLKPLVIEMYIRALTTDMNELERQKDANEKEKVEATTSRLAEAFCNLADFLDEHVKVARECVLTAFSLEPTKERMTYIETLAKRSGYQVLDTGQEWKCKLHPPVLPSDDLTWICPECGDWMCKPQLNIPLKINMALNEALQNSVLGISEPLCDDLVVCLSNPRYQILSWFLPWDDLHRLCIMYLQDPQTTKNFVTELKFVDIDYSIFKGIKREPLDELAGIERGYEQYLDQDFVSDEETSSVSGDSMSQDSRPYSLGSDGAGEGPCLPLLLSQPKSDPNTLKSLRMFRPNLKRVRTHEADNSIAEKLLKAESGALNLAQPQALTSNFKDPLKAAPKANLSTYINGMPSNTHHDSHSKNVKVATLPPLGGQVANNVIKSIQVLLHPLKSSQLPKSHSGQAHKPHNQFKGTITKATKKELMLKLLSKPSLNGFKENNSHQSPNNSRQQDFPPPTADAKISVKSPTIINKEPKSLQTIALTSKVRTQQPNVETVRDSSTPNLASSVNDQLQLPPNLKQTPVISCARLNSYRPPMPLLGQQQNPVFNQENSQHYNEDLTEKTQKADKAASSLTPDWCKNTDTKRAALLSSRKEKLRLISQKLEMAQRELNLTAKKRDKSPLSTKEVQSPRSQTNLKYPGSRRKHSPLLEKLVTSLGAKTFNKLPPCPENVLPKTPRWDAAQPHRDTSKIPPFPCSESPLLAACLKATKPSQDPLHDKTFPRLEIPHSTPCSDPTQSHLTQSPPVLENPQESFSEATIPSQDRLQNQPFPKILLPITPGVEVADSNPDQLQDQPPPCPKNLPPMTHVEVEVAESNQEKTLLCPENILMSCEESTESSPDRMLNQPLPCPAKLQLMSCEETTEANLDQLQKHLPPSPENLMMSCEESTKSTSDLMTIQPPACLESLQVMSCEEATEANLDQLQKHAPPSPENLMISCKESTESSLDRMPSQPSESLQVKLCKEATEANLDQLQEHPPASPENLMMSCKELTESSLDQTPSQPLCPESLMSYKGATKANLDQLQKHPHSSLENLMMSCEESTESNPDRIPSQPPLCPESLQLISCKEVTEANLGQYQNHRPLSPESVHVMSHEGATEVKLGQLKRQPAPSPENLMMTCEESTESNPDRMPSQPPLFQGSLQLMSCEEATKVNLDQSQKHPAPSTENHLMSCEESTVSSPGLIPEQPSPCQESHPMPCEELTKSCLDQISNQPLTSENIPMVCKESTESSPNKTHNQPTSCLETYRMSCEELTKSSPEQTKNQWSPCSENLPMSCIETTECHLDWTQDQPSPPQRSEYPQPMSCVEATNQDLIASQEQMSLRQEQTAVVESEVKDADTDVSTPPISLDPIEEVHPHTRPKWKESMQYCKERSEDRTQLKEDLPSLLLNKSVPESSCLPEPPLQEISLTIKISLDQIQISPNEKNTSPCPSPKLTINSSETTASCLGQLIPETHLPCRVEIGEIQADSEGPTCPEKIEDILGNQNKCALEEMDEKCNNTGVSLGNVQTEEAECSKPVISARKNCLGVIDDGLFSDLTGDETEDLFFYDDNGYSSFVEDVTENGPEDELPKNFNLTENIRTYVRKPTRKLPIVNKDCVTSPKGGDDLDVCKNVNSSISIQKIHSIVQKPETNCKELKVILCRLPSVNVESGRYASLTRIRKKCDRGRTPPRSWRRRRSLDKSENKVDKAPNRVQNHKLSPLQDINPRVTFKENSKSCCDDLIKPKSDVEEFMTPRVLLERIHVDKKKYARSVLANVPGLNDYQMIRPNNVNHIVNVVQVSGGRQNQNAPIQNAQTSTQVSPHIQRIGQPRVVEPKPENSNSAPLTATPTSTTSMPKTPTSQPSTLINILSQQIIRPVMTQSNTVRRQAPLINILSQQIIRPSLTQKTASSTNVIITENNQVKPSVTMEQSMNSQLNNVAKNANAGIKIASPTTTAPGSTILQFICKSTLPKFQQAFGKTIYQNSTDSSTQATTTIESTNIVMDVKKDITKTVPVNVQPIQGSVIYSRQVPVGQTFSLIPPGGTTRQVFRIATSNPEQLSLVKDTVIHSKMSALLAAALQARPKEGQSITEEKVTLTRPALVQSARIVKPVQLQIPPTVVRTAPQTNLSSTTLEQLREFDMVYKQVKERSSSTVPTETDNGPQETQELVPQRISVTYVNQVQKYTQLSPVVVVSTYNNLQPAASPALSVTSQGSSSPCVTPAPTLPKIATKTSKGKTLKPTLSATVIKAAPIPKPQQKPQEDEHTTQRIFDILAEYAEQLRNSPDLNNKPAPRRRSNPPTNPSHHPKRKKSSSSSSTKQPKPKSNPTNNNIVEITVDDIDMGSDSSGGGIVQLSVTDDEQSQAATINTPESTENSSPSSSRPLIIAEGSACANQSRNLIIADSSVGEALKMSNTAVIVPGSYIMPVSMVKGGQQIAVVSGGSKILATVPARSGQNMLLFQSFTNQSRKGSISAVKYSTIQPIAGISSQSLAGVSAQPPVILPSSSVATAMALGQPLTLKKFNDDRDGNELLLAITPIKEEPKCSMDLPQPDSSTSVSSDSTDIKVEAPSPPQSENSNEKVFEPFQKSVIKSSGTTSVIATGSNSYIKVEENSQGTSINMTLVPREDIKVEPKSNERMQSVLVTASSSNGPMLSHTTPKFKKEEPDTDEQTNIDLPIKEEYPHSRTKAKPSNNETKTFRTSTAYYVNKAKRVCSEKMDRDRQKTNSERQKMDSERQKQAALERELRLQKSLSEECEDLGVDEPSTSDLFPEADLLFDANHSPTYEHSGHRHDIKEEVKAAMNLFSDDDDTSSSLRSDIFEYVEYQTVETALDYQARQLMNGNASSSDSSSSCEDSTLLAKCPTMAEVTLNSPISPATCVETSSNKYKFKYSNRKKGERLRQGECRGEIVSSTGDTVTRVTCEDENFKLVHVAIKKTGQKCELHCDEDLDAGRRGRRNLRRLCSCCNGSQDGHGRKRPHTARPHTPAFHHKKAFLVKKR